MFFLYAALSFPEKREKIENRNKLHNYVSITRKISETFRQKRNLANDFEEVAYPYTDRNDSLIYIQS